MFVNVLGFLSRLTLLAWDQGFVAAVVVRLLIFLPRHI
uniref:Uncharacterized protein n=1 Tax=Setaria italica TaxID=4555 RepID=K4A4A7_SETIT